jgi:hypothetical protein
MNSSGLLPEVTHRANAQPRRPPRWRLVGICCATVFALLLFMFVSLVFEFRKRNTEALSYDASHRIDLFGVAAAEHEKEHHSWPESLAELNTPRWSADRPDPWGMRYRYEQLDDGCRISSAGPDRTFDTGDDIVTVFRKGGVVTSRQVGILKAGGKIGVPPL